MKVLERSNVIEYLKKRQLEKRYLKAKNYLKNDQLEMVDFKNRKPKSQLIYYFRINQKYRAIDHFIDDVFVVASISDHQ